LAPLLGVGVFQYRGLFEHLRLGLLENLKKLNFFKFFKKRIKMAIFHFLNLSMSLFGNICDVVLEG